VDNSNPIVGKMAAANPPGHEIVSRFTEGLAWDREGMWVPAASQAVSYPQEGSALCAAIEDTSFWFRHRNRVIAAVVGRWPPAAGPIFDIGGGNGYVALGLERAGHETVVVEPSRTGAANAARRGIATVISATLATAGFRPSSLSAAGMFDVLEHIEDDLACLRLLRTRLRPGGPLYITVPAFQWLWSNEDDFAGHYRRYTIRSLSQVLEKAGYAIDFASYFFSALPPAIFVLRSIPTKLGLRKAVTAVSTSREHGSGSGLSRWVLESILASEAWGARRGRRLPFGSSCICVARACAAEG
jgi:SAM-dependent methyltransferase